MEDITITIKDAREHFNGCIPGWKAFSETHKFDWPTVVKEGLKASELLSTKDAMAIDLVEAVYKKRGLSYGR